MPHDALKQSRAGIASRAVALYLMIAAAILVFIGALFFAAGLSAGEDQPGLATFAAIAAAFAVPGAGLGLCGLSLWWATSNA